MKREILVFGIVDEVQLRKVIDAIHVRQEAVVLKQLVQPGLVDSAQQFHRAVLQVVKGIVINPAKE